MKITYDIIGNSTNFNVYVEIQGTTSCLKIGGNYVKKSTEGCLFLKKDNSGDVYVSTECLSERVRELMKEFLSSGTGLEAAFIAAAMKTEEERINEETQFLSGIETLKKRLVFEDGELVSVEEKI